MAKNEEEVKIVFLDLVIQMKFLQNSLRVQVTSRL